MSRSTRTTTLCNHVGVANVNKHGARELRRVQEGELNGNSDVLKQHLVTDSFTGVLLECCCKTREAIPIMGSCHSRMSTGPISVELEGCKLRKSWQTLRIG